MPDEPSGYELRRAIEDLRSAIRDGDNAISQRLDRSVSAEVHASDMRRIDDRIIELAKDIADLHEAQERDRQVARAAKQWAIGIGIAAAGVLVAVVALVGNLL